MSVSGYSDTYAMDNMASGKAGKTSSAVPGFEVVPENRLDFEFYKNRDEFAADHGAGELFGRPSDIVRTGTPGTFGSGPGSDGGSRPGTPVGGMGFGAGRRVFSPQTETPPGTSYAPGYIPPSQQHTAYGGTYTPPSLTPTPFDGPARTRSPFYAQGNDSESNLVHNAAGMSTMYRPSTPGGSRGMSIDEGSGRTLSGLGLGNPLSPGMLGGGPHGYGGLPQTDAELATPPLAAQGQDPAQYDYFRGSRRRDASGTPGAATRNVSNGWGGN